MERTKGDYLISNTTPRTFIVVLVFKILPLTRIFDNIFLILWWVFASIFVSSICSPDLMSQSYIDDSRAVYRISLSSRGSQMNR